MQFSLFVMCLKCKIFLGQTRMVLIRRKTHDLNVTEANIKNILNNLGGSIIHVQVYYIIISKVTL